MSVNNSISIENTGSTSWKPLRFSSGHALDDDDDDLSSSLTMLAAAVKRRKVTAWNSKTATARKPS